MLLEIDAVTQASALVMPKLEDLMKRQEFFLSALHDVIHLTTIEHTFEIRFTAIEQLHAAVTLLDADLSAFDSDEVRRQVATVHSAQNVLHGLLVRLADRARVLEAAGSGAPAEEAMLGAGGVSSASARRHAARSELGADFPLTGAAIRSGSAHSASVDALARVWRRLDSEQRERFATTFDRDLSNEIGTLPIDTFARLVAHRARSVRGDDGVADLEAQVAASGLRIVRRRNGMHRLVLDIDPLRGSELADDIASKARSIVQRDTDSDTRRAVDDHVRAEALHELVRAGAMGKGSGVPRSTRITILCDQKTAAHGVHDDSVCETYGGDHVPRSVLERLACDAVVQPVYLDADGNPFDLGRATHTATLHQKLALRSLYDSCPLSGTPFRDCEIHHVTFWRNDGPTDLDNLVPISRRWHHLVHDAGWKLVMHPDRSLDLYRPDGVHHRHVGPPIPMTRRRTRRRTDPGRSEPLAA